MYDNVLYHTLKGGGSTTEFLTLTVVGLKTAGSWMANTLVGTTAKFGGSVLRFFKSSLMISNRP